MKVLVSGATGFMGRYVVRALSSRGHDVRGLSRDPTRSSSTIPMLQGDVSTGTGLCGALEGVDVAYYLVHSLERDNPEGFVTRDRRAAHHFASAAREAGVRRVVYCGVSPASDARAARSTHRESRAEVADILVQAIPESVCLRSWTVLSPHNQFIRFLVQLLRHQHIVALPPSSRFRYQPIDARDLADALVAAATSTEVAGRAVDVVGRTVVDTQQLCRGLCEQLGLRRRFVTLPFTPPAWALKGHLRAAKLDPEFFLPVLASVAMGDVLPAHNWLDALVGAGHSFADSLAYAAQARA